MARKKKIDDGLCAFNHTIAVRISQENARRISLGGFLPREVADQMIADVEALYASTESRERIAKLGGM